MPRAQVATAEVAPTEEVEVGLGECRLEPRAPLRLVRLAEPLRRAVREGRLPEVVSGGGALPVRACPPPSKTGSSLVEGEPRRVDEGLHAVLREIEPGQGRPKAPRHAAASPSVAGEGEGLAQLHLEVDLADVRAELLTREEAPREERLRLGEAPRLGEGERQLEDECRRQRRPGERCSAAIRSSGRG